MVEATVTLVEGMRFRGETESGHTIVMDTSEDFGGDGVGVDPIELLLVALGGCTGMDVISILRKKRQEVTGYEINISGDRSEDHPKVYEKIRVEHVVHGKSVDPAAVQRAVDLSTTKYCPVIGMLGKVADIETMYRVVEA